MPSHLSTNRVDRKKIVFIRSTWVNRWPNSEVLCLADPAMQQSEALDGAWFIHPEFDVISNIAQFVREIADERKIEYKNVVFYGSSLGGFGAIAAAAHLEGSKAVAENPQIDFEFWSYSPRVKVEEEITKRPIAEYRKIHPEQISLISRLELAGRIPRFRLVTNPSELSLHDQIAFYGWVKVSTLPKMGETEMFVTNESHRHQQLPPELIVPHVNPNDR